MSERIPSDGWVKPQDDVASRRVKPKLSASDNQRSEQLFVTSAASMACKVQRHDSCESFSCLCTCHS